MSKISDFYFNARNGLEWLQPAFEGWADCMGRYLKSFRKQDQAGKFWDVPYFYNERTNIGLLAAGAYTGGLVSLEEYVSSKERGVHRHGRADLYISSDEVDIAIEAKSHFIESTNRPATLKSKLQSAVHDSKQNFYAKQMGGCVFYVPRLPRRRSLELATSDLKEVLSSLQVLGEETDLLAWYLPNDTRMFAHAGYIWPGVITIMQRTKPAGRISGEWAATSKLAQMTD